MHHTERHLFVTFTDRKKATKDEVLQQHPRNLKISAISEIRLQDISE